MPVVTVAGEAELLDNWGMQGNRALEGATSAALRSKVAPTALSQRSFGQRIAITATILMVVASVMAVVMRPKPRDSSLPPSIVLETAVPKAFGTWRELPAGAVQVVNPQTHELLDKLYSQTLSRTYVNTQGYKVMLSLAYGDDQRGGLQAHMPEVCYPAQGFKLDGISNHALETPWGAIPAKRVLTSLGARIEPITYWFAMGDRAVGTALEKRLVEVRFGLTGQVPDGILFRVSSIDSSSDVAFAQQQLFVQDMLRALAPDQRVRLTGLSAAAAH